MKISENLTERQLEFLQEEFGLTLEEIEKMEEEQFDDFYNKLCDIEEDELSQCDDPDGEDLSERCMVAGDLVTIFGNTF